jgi:hypothetical protein
MACSLFCGRELPLIKETRGKQIVSNLGEPDLVRRARAA